jgi:hypothetical protein
LDALVSGRMCSRARGRSRYSGDLASLCGAIGELSGPFVSAH